MQHRILSVFILLILAAGCTKDGRERLFEMIYPNIRFDIPAGLPSGRIPQVLVLDDQETRYDFFLRSSGFTDADVAVISPATANLYTPDGFDFDYVDLISVRICPQNTPSCLPGDEVFYLEYEDIWRQGSNVRLLPSLINAKRILGKEQYKLEVWFNFNIPTPVSIQARLDMRFEAGR